MHRESSAWTGLAPENIATSAEPEPAEPHVLHSRGTRQLDHDYRTDPAPPGRETR